MIVDEFQNMGAVEISSTNMQKLYSLKEQYKKESVEAYNKGYTTGYAHTIHEDENRNYLWDFAGLAMQGRLAGGQRQNVDVFAVQDAKELIKQLEAEK